MINFDEILTAEQKRELLQARLNQFAAEAYQHELNRQLGVSLENNELVDASEKALGELEAAINVHKSELDALAE